MLKPHELRRLAAQKLAEANEIVKKAESENRLLSDDERASIKSLTKEHDDLQAQAEDVEVLDRANSRLSEIPPRPAIREVVEMGRARHEDDPMFGFKSPREFLLSIMSAGKTGRVDDRLRPLNVEALTAGSDEHGAYADSVGGFLMPNAMVLGLKTTEWEGDPTSAFTTKVPMSVPSIEFPARVDKDHTSSVSGGFRVYRVAETQTVEPSRTAFEKIALTASDLMGVTFATKRLIDFSAPSIVPIIEAGFRDEFGSKILDEKLRGTGVGEYLGLLSSPALITVTAESGQGAGTIVYKNLVNMLSRIWRKGRAIWLYNADCLTQLMTMTNPAGQLIWQQSARDGAPSRILGCQLNETDECCALGTAGDLMLLNMSEYLEGTLQPLESASSIHVRFLNNETAFRFTMSNAGAPWWRSVLTPKHGNTRSPYVVLSSTRT